MTHPNDDAVANLARRLEQAGLWVSRTVWTTATGVEVSADDPDATQQDTILEIDYARIVRLVLEGTTTSEAVGGHL